MRPSDNSPGDYSLFFHINNQIQRFRVEKKGVRYVMGGRTFDCLDAVINRYKTEQIVEGHTLGHPVKRVSLKQQVMVEKLEKMSQFYHDFVAFSLSMMMHCFRCIYEVFF